MVRLKGGSPKSMRQGQYWVRRHLDDQKRHASAQRREVAAEERSRKADARAASAEQKVRERLSREHAAATSRLAMWQHFEKIQNELKRALNSVMAGKCDTYETRIEFASEKEAEKLGELQRTYQEHSDWLNNKHESISASTVTKHIQNIRKMLTQLGRGLGLKTCWKAREMAFTFGDITLDFSEPKPIAESAAESHSSSRAPSLKPRRAPNALNDELTPAIAPVGISFTVFPVIAFLVLMIAIFLYFLA